MADLSMMKHFRYDHLPPDLQAVSRQFHDLAEWLLKLNPITDPREQQVAVRKLLEAKDAAVRSVVPEKVD